MMVPSYSNLSMDWKKQPKPYMTTSPNLAFRFMSAQKNGINVLPTLPSPCHEPKGAPPSVFKLNKDENDVYFTDKFKYFGSIITLYLMVDAKVKAQIKNVKSPMGIPKHCFSCKDVAQHVKYWINIAGSLNTLLWGSESWNISDHNHDKLHAFHQSANRRILGIWMDEVIEFPITNEQVRWWFENTPLINDCIMRRTWNYTKNKKWITTKEDARSLGISSKESSQTITIKP